QMNKLAGQILADPDPLHPSFKGRGENVAKWHGDFLQAQKRAIAQARSMRDEISHAETELAATYRSRWHGVGAAALTAGVLALGCLLFWLLFDRELRRSWKSRSRLADNEARFRWLVENQSEPIVVLDAAGAILYVNPIWHTAFGYELDELQAANFFDMIHAD